MRTAFVYCVCRMLRTYMTQNHSFLFFFVLFSDFSCIFFRAKANAGELSNCTEEALPPHGHTSCWNEKTHELGQTDYNAFVLHSLVATATRLWSMRHSHPHSILFFPEKILEFKRTSLRPGDLLNTIHDFSQQPLIETTNPFTIPLTNY